jgi:nucleoside-diphosphate-sugar epimerase
MTSSEPSPNASLHVVLGGGQIGDRLAGLLARRGQRVRVVQRSARSESRPNVTRLSGDLTDPAFAARAAEGASVVYDCMNPQYYQWPTHLLPLGGAALSTARSAGARLVALDCLYMYGAPQGPMREDSPRTPCSKKGALRVELEALRMQAHARGEVEVAIGRASDFFGADVPLSLFGPRFFERLRAGKSIECMGDPDMLHSYSYAEDVARDLAILGSDPRALGKVWHMSVAPAETTRQLLTRVATELGRELSIQRVPRWLVRTLGLFSPMMREFPEMIYQWEGPYVLDDAQFQGVFGVRATPLDRAVRELAEWARGSYGFARAA